MAETLSILKDTPIPTLMILGGIALLVLSVASSIGGKVKVNRDRQKWSGITGLLLVLIGVLLYVVRPASVTGGATTPTAIAVVTMEPSPTSTPDLPTRVPSQTPTLPPAIACLTPPQYFAEYWSGRVAQLGCPLSANAGGFQMYQQAFEHGWMIRREDTLSIYVLYSDRSYQVAQDTWEKGQPEYSCPQVATSKTPPTPRNFFGKIWCQEDVRSRLGSATDAEQAMNAILQSFDHGLIFQLKKQLFVLVDTSNTWEQLE